MTDSRRELRAPLAPAQAYRSTSSGSDSSAGSSASNSPTIKPVSEKQPVEVTATFRGLSAINSLKKVALAISVGKEKHEGANFEATLALLNQYHARHQFDLTIIYGGSLQRHNFWQHLHKFTNDELAVLIEQLSPEAFTSIDNMAEELAERLKPQAVAEEKKYIARIQQSLAYLTVTNVTQTSWDDWFQPQHPAYASYKTAYTRLIQLYNEKQEYREALSRTSETFLKKKGKAIEEIQTRMTAIDARFKQFDFKLLAMTSSRNYLLEEMPLIMLEWENHFSHIAYPSGIELAFKFLQDHAKELGYKGSLAWLEIDIQNVKPEKKKEEPIRGHSATLRQLRVAQPDLQDLSRPQESKTPEHKTDHGRHACAAAASAIPASSPERKGNEVLFPPLTASRQQSGNSDFGFSLFAKSPAKVRPRKRQQPTQAFMERASSLPDLHQLDTNMEYVPFAPASSPKEFTFIMAFPLESLEAAVSKDVTLTPRTRASFLTNAHSAAQMAAQYTFFAAYKSACTAVATMSAQQQAGAKQGISRLQGTQEQKASPTTTRRFG